MSTPKYRINQNGVFYDPSGNQGAGLPAPHNRASIQAIDTSTDPATYTIIVLKMQNGGLKPQKPPVSGVAESSLYAADAPASGTFDG